MKSLQRTAITSALAMFLGLIVTVPITVESANAAGAITKTIVVRGADGNLLPNALVAVGYTDETDPLGWGFTNPVATNSSGQAVISGLPVADYSEVYVQPAIDDTANGFGYANSRSNSPLGVFTLQTSSTFNIRLLASTIRLNLKTSNGSEAPVRTGIYWPSDSTYNYWSAPHLLREGAFGINIDSSLNCNNDGNWQIQFRYYSETIGDAADNGINLKATGCPSRTLELKDKFTGTNYPKVGDVWQVSSRKTNFNFTIVSPNDQSTALSGSWLEICPVLLDGSIENCFGSGNKGGVGVPDGTYKLRANAGDSGFSATDFTAVVSDDGVTTSLKVGYPASETDVPVVNGRAIFATGVPNLSGTIVKPDGSSFTLTNNQGFDVQLLKDNGGGDYQRVSGTWSRGPYAFSITATGSYKIDVRPQGLPQYVSTRSPEIIVTSDVGGIKLSTGGSEPASVLSYALALSTPNFSLNVLNPITQQPMTGGWVSVENLNDSDQRTGWYGNLDINPNYPGVAAGMFVDGKYLLTVNPPQGNQTIAGLASKQYVLIVSDSGTTLVLHIGNLSTGDTVSADLPGQFTVTTGEANVVGRFLDSAGQGVPSNNTSYAQVCLQRQMSDGVNWEWLTCTQTSSNGGFSMSAGGVGTYRVSIAPQGRSDIATTILSTFVITTETPADFKQDYGNVTAASPTLKIRVREIDGTTNIKNAGVEVRKDNQFITWANTAQSGVVALNLSAAGSYQLVVNPTPSTPNSTRRLYTVTAIAGDGGAISASIEGVTPDGNGISTLFLGTAQIKGRVLLPEGNTGVANSWVVAVDKATNQELWQYGSNSSQNGSFAMSLPEGSYTLFARSPNGNISVGNSNPIGDVAIAADGVVTITGAAFDAGLTASDFNIRLASPYWSGKVLPPTGEAGVANARVCLNTVIAGTQFWNCASTDSQGRWAMAKPNGFIEFGSNDQLQVAENQSSLYSMATYSGASIESSGFLAAGGSSIDLRLAAPNFSVQIVYGADATPASNLWVNVNVINGEWIGGSSTDANGFARFFVSDLTQGVQVNVDPSNNAEVSAVAAATVKIYQTLQMADFITGDPAVFLDTITLAVPNIRGLVSNPGTTTRIANSWVELFDSSGMWLGGSNTNSSGYFALNAPEDSTYRLNVNPPWSGNSTATNRSYEIVVLGGIVTSFIDKTTNQPVVATTFGTGEAYPLTLGTPSVIGKVVDPTSATVQNSWVFPINSSNIQLWQLGRNSRGDGTFSMAVPDGSYKIQASTPWNSSTYSSSAGCAITILNGAVTTSAGACVQSDKKLVLTLRAPNLNVIVRDSTGTPLRNANVGLGVGNWNAHGRTDSNGLASLFVDPSAIDSANNENLDGPQNIWMWIDPPYGNSDVVRSQCYSGQVGTACATLAQVTPGDGTFSNPQITTDMSAPNTSVYVMRPGTPAVSAGVNAWVSILSIQKNVAGAEIGRSWIAGGNTDFNGKATFNIDTTTATSFVVQIEAPWNQRDLYAGNSFGISPTGLSFEQVNGQSFALREPNLKIHAQLLEGSSAISGGWISVENAITDGGVDYPSGWVGGYGLDQSGKVSLTLAANSRFRLTINPAPGVDGVAASCFVATNVSGEVEAVTGPPTCSLVGTVLTIKLPKGNVVGTVTGPNGVVAGAIVSAVPVNLDESRDSLLQQVTSTDKNGNYNLQLDDSRTWDITVTPVNTPSDTVQLQTKTEVNTPIFSPSTTVSFTLSEVA